MEILEGKLYFIKDEFIEKYNSKYELMKNKTTGTKRPTYFCIRDRNNSDMLCVTLTNLPEFIEDVNNEIYIDKQNVIVN